MHNQPRLASHPPRVNNEDTLPEVFVRNDEETWTLCGEGVFSWSVFRFYRARLLTRSGVFSKSEPFLLDLHYLRSLSASQIVSISLEEMARLSPNETFIQQTWSESLLSFLPDVTLGDRLLGWFVPGERVTFYSATQQLGQMNDPSFVNQFSAIWLDERTQSPSLRRALLGTSAEVGI